MVLVHSPDTRPIADAIVASNPMPPGAIDYLDVHDPQDLAACVQRMRALEHSVRAWVLKGKTFQVVVDITGGTKCMSAAMALVARRWPCQFSYIGGKERTKGGVGIVVSGREEALVAQNPWNVLGYQAIEDAFLLFDRAAFMHAAAVMERARAYTDDDGVKRLLSTCHQLCEGYGLWDQFQHHAASARFANVLKNAADLEAALGGDRAFRVLRQVREHQTYLRSLPRTPIASLAFICDVLANARRRWQEGRYDDAVARLYRAIEALAQHVLSTRHGIHDTANVPRDRVPAPFVDVWNRRADGGPVRLGLQAAYGLLHALGDSVGRSFADQGLNDTTSPLIARNSSLLAHGFQPVGRSVFESLWKAAMHLGREFFREDDLPVFPRLSD
jgi:CRISPR-associated protein (TIGR02710 family)